MRNDCDLLTKNKKAYTCLLDVQNVEAAQISKYAMHGSHTVSIYLVKILYTDRRGRPARPLPAPAPYRRRRRPAPCRERGGEHHHADPVPSKSCSGRYQSPSLTVSLRLLQYSSNRAGTSHRRPSSQPWAAAWHPLPLKLHVGSHQAR